jgi:hypothetical protein
MCTYDQCERALCNITSHTSGSLFTLYRKSISGAVTLFSLAHVVHNRPVAKRCCTERLLSVYCVLTQPFCVSHPAPEGSTSEGSLKQTLTVVTLQAPEHHNIKAMLPHRNSRQHPTSRHPSCTAIRNTGCGISGGGNRRGGGGDHGRDN